MFRVAKITTQETTFGIAIEQLCQGSSLVFYASISLEINRPPIFAPCPVNSCKRSHGEVYHLRHMVETQKEEQCNGKKSGTIQS